MNIQDGVPRPNTVSIGRMKIPLALFITTRRTAHDQFSLDDPTRLMLALTRGDTATRVP